MNDEHVFIGNIMGNIIEMRNITKTTNILGEIVDLIPGEITRYIQCKYCECLFCEKSNCYLNDQKYLTGEEKIIKDLIE